MKDPAIQHHEPEQYRLILRDVRIWNRAIALLHSIRHKIIHSQVIYEVIIREWQKERTLDQNAKLHAMFTDISKQLQWDGEWLDVESWKRLLTAGWMTATGRKIKLVRAIEGEGFTPLYQRTSKLNVKETIELIEYVTAWAVDKGVHFYDTAKENFNRRESHERTDRTASS